MPADSRLAVRLATAEMIAIDLERLEAKEPVPVSFPDLRDGGIYIHRGYQSWQKALREGKGLPASAMMAIGELAGACLKYLSDLGDPDVLQGRTDELDKTSP